jgi:tRNA dimethylallyltransferase
MGPTASGKSALALALAERLGGEIVNADSMQVYSDLRVLTARPTGEETAKVPHHLYGHIGAETAYSVGRWLTETLAAIDDIRTRGATPILVGGTGLYFKALTEGLVDIPKVDANVRARLRARARALGAPALHEELLRVDPETAARLGPNDAPRILRALEVWETTGASISALQAGTAPAFAREGWAGFALTPERAALYDAIDARFAGMIASGALDEVRKFAARGLDIALPAMKAHGAPALMASLRGEMNLADAVEVAKRDTRRYAKRQFTWITNQISNWPRIAASELGARLNAALSMLR